MKSSDLHGIWKVMKHKLSDQKRDDYNELMSVFDEFSLKGARLEINENGHMAWNGVSNAKMYPFLKAKSFNLVGVCSSVLIGMFVGKGSLKVEFEVELEEDALKLHHKHGFVLEMQRISEKTSDEKHFSLSDALNDGEFSDLEIIAKNGKHIFCHKCILSSVFVGQNWEDVRNFLSGMDEDIIMAALHLSYFGCLPSWLNSKCASKLLAIFQEANVLPSTCNIIEIIENYLQCLAVRDELEGVACEIESCFANAMHLVIGFESILADNLSLDSNEMVGKLIDSWKRFLQEVILGVFSLVFWCKIFTEKKNIMSMKIRDEASHKIIAIFSTFGKEFAEKHNVFGSKLTIPSSGILTKISEALLPEFEQLLEAAPELYKSWTKSVTNLLDHLIETNAQDKAAQKGPKFFWRIYNEIMSDDMTNLHSLKEGLDGKVDEAFEILENARSSNRAGKIKVLSDLLKAAIKIVVFDVSPHIGFGTDERSIFKVALVANRMTCIIEKLQKQKCHLAMLTKALKGLVCRESFNVILDKIGLADSESTGNKTLTCDKSSNEKKYMDADGTYLTAEPPAEKNFLSQSLEKLLESSLLSDVEFVVSEGADDEFRADKGGTVGPDKGIAVRPDKGVAVRPDKGVVFKAHRIIVASRCTWFKRALGSGMKESIERIFYIKDCLPDTFMKFLRYLYVGYLNEIEKFSVETLVDLMTLADRYGVDELRETCETHLISIITEDNIKYLESFAKNIIAEKLKNAIASYAHQHTEKKGS